MRRAIRPCGFPLACAKRHLKLTPPRTRLATRPILRHLLQIVSAARLGRVLHAVAPIAAVDEDVGVRREAAAALAALLPASAAGAAPFARLGAAQFALAATHADGRIAGSAPGVLEAFDAAPGALAGVVGSVVETFLLRLADDMLFRGESLAVRSSHLAALAHYVETHVLRAGEGVEAGGQTRGAEWPDASIAWRAPQRESKAAERESAYSTMPYAVCCVRRH